MLFRENAKVDDFIHVIEGNRKYIKCVYVYNKIDVVGIDDVDAQQNSIVISCNLKARMANAKTRIRSCFIFLVHSDPSLV